MSAGSAEVPADCGPPAGLQRPSEVMLELSAGLGLWTDAGSASDTAEPERSAGSEVQPRGQSEETLTDQ